MPPHSRRRFIIVPEPILTHNKKVYANHDSLLDVKYRHATMDSQGGFAQAERLVHKGLIVILEWEPVLNNRREIEMALDFVNVGPCTMLWPNMKNMGSAENKTAYLRFASPAEAVAAAKALENGKSIGGPVRGRVATMNDSIIPDTDKNKRHVVVNENGSPIIRERIGGTRIAPIFGRESSDDYSGFHSGSGSGSGGDDDYDSNDEVRWGKVRILNEDSLRSDPASRVLWPLTAAIAAEKRSRTGFNPNDPFACSPAPVAAQVPAPVPSSPPTNPPRPPTSPPPRCANSPLSPSPPPRPPPTPGNPRPTPPWSEAPTPQSAVPSTRPRRLTTTGRLLPTPRRLGRCTKNTSACGTRPIPTGRMTAMITARGPSTRPWRIIGAQCPIKLPASWEYGGPSWHTTF